MRDSRESGRPDRRARRERPRRTASGRSRGRATGSRRSREFGNPIGWKVSPRIGAVNHLSIAKTRWRSVWTNDHSSSTDSCSLSSGRAFAMATVLAHSASRAAHVARMSSGFEGRSIARSGYHGSRSFTNAVTSTPLMTTLSTSASMSTLTSQAWLIFASVRLTSRKRAPLRSAPQNTAPARSPSNSSGMLPPVASRRSFVRFLESAGNRPQVASCIRGQKQMPIRSPSGVGALGRPGRWSSASRSGRSRVRRRSASRRIPGISSRPGSPRSPRRGRCGPACSRSRGRSRGLSDMRPSASKFQEESGAAITSALVGPTRFVGYHLIEGPFHPRACCQRGRSSSRTWNRWTPPASDRVVSLVPNPARRTPV